MEMALLKDLKGMEINPSSVWTLFSGDGIRVENGYTKVVIIPEKEDFVIKIPREDSVKYNYCEREAHVYEKAEKWGIDFLFAKTTRAGAIDKSKHLYYYQQTKVEKFGYQLDRRVALMNNPIIDRQVKKAMEVNDKRGRSRYGDCSYEWYAYVLKAYGYDSLVKLLLFLRLMKINDLRGDNVGFKDGKPILIDYSGFHGGHKS